MRRIILYVTAVFISVYAIIAVFSYKKDIKEEDNSNPVEVRNVADELPENRTGDLGTESKGTVFIDQRFSDEFPAQTEYLGVIENLEKEAEISEEAREIYDKRDSYSDTLLKLASNRVDAINFVYKAKENRDKVDISYEESYHLNRKTPLYIQWDPRWGYKFYEDYFAIIGCGPTTVAMIVSGYKDKVDPITIMENMYAKQYYIKDVGTSWDGITNQLKENGMSVESIPLGENTFKQVLQNGGVVLLSMRAGHFTTLGHYMLIAGLDQEGNFLINDPNSIRNSIRPWKYEEISSEIKGCWSVN